MPTYNIIIDNTLYRRLSPYLYQCNNHICCFYHRIMGAKAFLVTYLQVSALLFAVDHFPENTPKRWEAIALYLEHHHEQNNDQMFDTFTIAHPDHGSKRKCSKEIFTGSALQCKELAQILQFYPTLYSSLKEQYMPLLSRSLFYWDHNDYRAL